MIPKTDALTVLSVLNSGYIRFSLLSMRANLLVLACCLGAMQRGKNKLNMMLAALCFTDAFYGGGYSSAAMTPSF